MDTNSALTDTHKMNLSLRSMFTNYLQKRTKAAKESQQRYQSWLENEWAQALEAVSQWQTVADFRHTPWETALTVSFEKPSNWNWARRKDTLLRNYYIPHYSYWKY